VATRRVRAPDVPAAMGVAGSGKYSPITRWLLEYAEDGPIAMLFPEVERIIGVPLAPFRPPLPALRTLLRSYYSRFVGSVADGVEDGCR
jgi:hypothetical protein